MVRHARNNKGFSLVELLIAMALIMISMLALLTSMLTTMNTNMKNEIRNTAIVVANQTAEALLALPIDDAELAETPDLTVPHTRIAGNAVQTDKGLPEVNQKVRNYQVGYTITWTVEKSSSNLKKVNVTVSYIDQKKPGDPPYSYSSLIYKHRAI